MAEPQVRPQAAPGSRSAVAPTTRPVRLAVVKMAYCTNSRLARCMPRMAAANGNCTR